MCSSDLPTRRRRFRQAQKNHLPQPSQSRSVMELLTALAPRPHYRTTRDRPLIDETDQSANGSGQLRIVYLTGQRPEKQGGRRGTLIKIWGPVAGGWYFAGHEEPGVTHCFCVTYERLGCLLPTILQHPDHVGTACCLPSRPNFHCLQFSP